MRRQRPDECEVRRDETSSFGTTTGQRWPRQPWGSRGRGCHADPSGVGERSQRHRLRHPERRDHRRRGWSDGAGHDRHGDPRGAVRPGQQQHPDHHRGLPGPSTTATPPRCRGRKLQHRGGRDRAQADQQRHHHRGRQRASSTSSGIHIRDSSNIIIQNVTIRNVKKSGSPTSNGGDAIGMESTVRNVWVDHVTLEASGGESEGYDGPLRHEGQHAVRDPVLQHPAQLRPRRPRRLQREATLSKRLHHLSPQPVREHRLPYVRCCAAAPHIYNNHYVSLHESGINSRAGAKAKVENNYFRA